MLVHKAGLTGRPIQIKASEALSERLFIQKNAGCLITIANLRSSANDAGRMCPA